MLKQKRIYMIPVFSFILLILLFALVLILPISTKYGISFFNSLFIATSSITGTGLTTINIANNFTVFGKIVLMVSIQVGSLGFMMLYSFILFAKNKKINLSNTLILSNEINLNNLSKVKEKTYKIVKYTFFIEFFGALLLSIFFVPEYGVKKGLWYGLFHSISAFCNAGFDILGDNSFCRYTDNIFINLIIISLMYLGSIGFFVIENVHSSIKYRNKHLQVYSKIIIVTSILLILVPTLLFKLLSPNITFLQSLFLSVTCRSTGLYTFSLSSLDRVSKLLLTFLMFIGGATSGIRITNFVLMILLPYATIRNEEIIIGYRKIDYQTIKKSITIVISYVFFVFIGFLIMLGADKGFASEDLIFELVSAVSKTGLETFSTADLSYLSKVILIIYMYIGRLGILTLMALLSFKNKKHNNSITYPNADLML